MSADPDGKQPILSGDFGGQFEIGSYSPLDDAFDAHFQFSRRTLTPGNDEIAAALTRSGCGKEDWVVGVAQDVHEAGCIPFRVLPAASCAGEFDIVAMRRGRLFLGARPADGDLCSESKRPTKLTEHALTRRKS